MNSFDKLKLRMSASGTTEREEKIKDSQTVLLFDNDKDISYCDTLYLWSIVANTNPVKINARVFDRKYSETYGNTMKFQSSINEPIIVGNILNDTSDNSYWLCIESHNDYTRNFGKLAECNWMLKWQKSDGTILEYPCLDHSKSNIGGEDESKVITLGDAQHLLTLPCDDNTILIRTPQRFILDKHPTKPIPFKVVQNNTTSHKGLVRVVVEQDVLKDGTIDRIDLGICDYFTHPTTPPPNQSGILSYSIITCSNPANTITLGGSPRTLTPIFYDDTVENTTITAFWTYTLPHGLESYIDIVPVVGTNKVQIKVKDNIELLDKTMTATVSDVVGGYQSNITLKIVVS